MTLLERKMLEQILQTRLEDEVTVRQMKIIVLALRASFSEMDQIAMDAQGKGDDTLLNTFIDAKRVNGCSDRTLERYAYIMRRFLTEEKITISYCTVDNIRHWMSCEMERGISENTLRGYRDVMCSCFGWLWKEGLIISNPCANLEPIKVPKLVRKPYTPAEIEKIKEACGKSLRDKAIVCFLLATGCRIEEVTNLNRDDVDLRNKECTVFGKGAKERVVYLDDVSAMVLQRYLESRKDDFVALFPGKRGRLTPDGIRRMLKRIEKTLRRREYPSSPFPQNTRHDAGQEGYERSGGGSYPRARESRHNDEIHLCRQNRSQAQLSAFCGLIAPPVPHSGRVDFSL